MPVIELSFDLVGGEIPLDHGYALFSTLCRIVPSLHGDRRIGVHPIRGRRTAPGVLSLTESSRLSLRLPAEHIAPYIAIAGRTLELEGQRVDVRIPRVDELRAAPNLASRLVTFRHAMSRERFEADVRRDLDQLGISGSPSLVPASSPRQPGEPIRRVLTIKDRRIVGYALRVTGMDAAESIRLQEEGLGGRRRMGCGIFTPFSPETRWTT